MCSTCNGAYIGTTIVMILALVGHLDKNQVTVASVRLTSCKYEFKASQMSSIIAALRDTCGYLRR
jgi:hypothetical protein